MIMHLPEERGDRIDFSGRKIKDAKRGVLRMKKSKAESRLEV